MTTRKAAKEDDLDAKLEKLRRKLTHRTKSSELQAKLDMIRQQARY